MTSDNNDEMRSVSAGSFLKRFSFTPTITEEEAAELERKEREDRKREAFNGSGVVGKYLDFTRDDFRAETEEQRNALKVADEYIRDVSAGQFRSLWLTGKPGTGKTMLACIITRELWGKYRKSYQIVNEARQAGSYSGMEDMNQLVERYAEYRHLVIDEVGKNTGYKAEELNVLWQIINERYERQKPTIIVSNLSKQELAEYLGLHIVDRFAESCRAVEFNGGSYRKSLREI